VSARFLALAATLLLPVGAADPPWIPFSDAMAELTRSEEFREAFLKRLDQSPAGEFLGPEQIDRLRKILLERDWKSLDAFPGITVAGLERAVKIAGLAAKKQPEKGTLESSAPLGREDDFGIPTGGAPLALNAFLEDLGMGLLWGDRVDPALAAMHADSARLADVLNRLARGAGSYRVKTPWGVAQTPEQIIDFLAASGHDIDVRDGRYFANFGDLIYHGRDVLTPFWMDTLIVVPGTRRSLLVPAGHAQHELWVKGARVNVDIALYFGIDGKAVFRPIDTKDQAWVMGRAAHDYRGSAAREVIRLAGLIVAMYDRIQKKNSQMAFNGYYELGVCNEVSAMIEMKMQGETTLYPLPHDPKWFDGDTEADVLARRLPVDGRGGRGADFRRILGSLPVDDPAKLPLEPLRSDLLAVQSAFDRGELTRRLPPIFFWAGGILLLAALAFFLRWRRKGA
jgi:hypothetical protein